MKTTEEILEEMKRYANETPADTEDNLLWRLAQQDLIEHITDWLKEKR